ncbi:MAG: methyl-accepting chemotaxis protein [Parvibaculum sp.]
MTNLTLLQRLTRLMGRVEFWTERPGIGVSNGRQHRELASASIAVHHMQRICACSIDMLPAVIIVAVAMSWASWGSPGQAFAVSGAALSLFLVSALIPLRQTLSRLAELDSAETQRQLARIHVLFCGNALVSGFGWSMAMAGLMLSENSHLIGISAIGAPNFLPLPSANLFWLSGMIGGLFTAVMVTGYEITVFFFPLAVVFAIIMWRNTAALCSNFAGYLLQSDELAQAREREFALRQNDAAAVAERDQRAQAELVLQREQHKAAQRQSMAALAEAFEHSVVQTIDRLTAALAQLGTSAAALHEIGEETDSSATQVTARASNVGLSVQHVATAIEQLNRSAQAIAQRVDAQHEAAAAARGATLSGSVAVSALATQAEKVSEITTLINEIASQTNLLALNATIEAARAGDAGRGFSVVAHEVKHLSGQTRGAIQSVDQTVQGIRARMDLTEMTIDSISDQIDLVTEGAAHIARVIADQGEATSDIHANTRQVANDARAMEETAHAVSHNAQRVKSVSDDMRHVTSQLEEQASALRRASMAFLAELKAA